ncbi:MAG TPA: ABC transporter permease [Chloroflexota bacterium]|nr:ABC transporter permease [Chloroflexota bacterium]
MSEMLLKSPAQPRAPAVGASPSAPLRLFSVLSIAVGGILTNKARALLTLLGVVIGVASVIVAVGIGNGSSAQVTAQISALGTNLIQVQPGATSFGGVRGGAGSASTLTAADAQAMADEAYPGGALPDVTMIAPEDSTNVQAVAGRQNTSTSADGVTPEYLQVRSAQVASGRFITTQDVVNQTQVAVLGATVITNLFPNQSDIVGSTITLNGTPYQVIGTMVSKGGGGGRNQDDTIFVPLTSVEYGLSNRAGATGAVSLIDAEAVTQSATTAAQGEIESLLRSRHKLTTRQSDDFSFFSQTSIQQTASNVSGTLTTLLTGIAAVSLLVGGIGIMNIMLVTVTERTREIGLRKAVGARKLDILLQFLTESILISGTGGGLGVGLSFLVAWFMVHVDGQATGLASSPPLISSNSVILAFGVSLAIGLFFGSYPASRAAALDPIQALRYE